jgi:hypothetical protein
MSDSQTVPGSGSVASAIYALTYSDVQFAGLEIMPWPVAFCFKTTEPGKYLAMASALVTGVIGSRRKLTKRIEADVFVSVNPSRTS